MSFDLDEKELREAVARGDADFLWSAYEDLLLQRAHYLTMHYLTVMSTELKSGVRVNKAHAVIRLDEGGPELACGLSLPSQPVDVGWRGVTCMECAKALAG